jgi:dTDP-4-dehydrorhamnose 3,5-epimerase-like enzyme
MPFEFKKLEIPDVILIKTKVFEDERGFFFWKHIKKKILMKKRE